MDFGNGNRICAAATSGSDLDGRGGRVNGDQDRSKTHTPLTPDNIRELFADINARLSEFQNTLRMRWLAHQASLSGGRSQHPRLNSSDYLISQGHTTRFPARYS